MKAINVGWKFLLAATMLLPGLSLAQSYPSKPVRVIVPFSPGGGTDFIGRLVGAKLAAVTGQPFVIENRLGAGSTIGTEAALKSPPDGYTLLLTSGSYTVVPNLYKLRYDPIKDMTPIIQPDDGPILIVLHPSLPARNVKEWVALAKARPGQINYASSGIGSISHLSTELFAMMAGIQLTHVPYKGTGQSITDTIAGQNQMLFSAIASAVPHVKSGRLRAIAATSARRVPVLPQVPTVIESGYAYEVSNWHGLVGPKGLPPAIVDMLNREINKIINEPEFVQRIAGDGLVPAGGPPERLLKLLTDELANWAKVAERVGLKVQ